MEYTYLVTGAAGHLGTNVVNELIKLNRKIRILVLPNEKNIPTGPNIEVFIGDTTKVETLVDFFKCENPIVIHCAGIVSIKSKFDELLRRVNIRGTKNITTLCKIYNVKKLVYISSVHAIPEKENNKVITEIEEFDPNKVIGYYAKTKAEATKYVLDEGKKGLNVNVIHPSGIIGPYDHGRGHLTQLIIDFQKGRLTSIVKGGYDFVDVRDVAKGIIECCDKGKPNECFILSNKYFTVKELVDKIATITEKKTIRHILPLWFVKFVAPLAEAYYRILKQPPLFTKYSMYTLNSNSNFSHDKATKELGYTTRPIEETIKDTYEWLKDNKRV